MDKQQKENTLKYFEKYSFDNSIEQEKQSQVKQYLLELESYIKDCSKDDIGSGHTIQINKRFFKKGYEQPLNIPEIYGEMIKNIGVCSKNNITIKSGRYELCVPENSKSSAILIKTHSFYGATKTKRYDTPYDAGKKFAELVGVNSLRGLNLPKLDEFIPNSLKNVNISDLIKKYL